MTKEHWAMDPGSGGQTIPNAVKSALTRRIEAYAAQHYAGQFIRLGIRFRAQFCYIDAYQEPTIAKGWPPDDWPETLEEFTERLRNVPIHLCRLRYFGDDRWGFAFYTYSNEQYELALFPNGTFYGTPEEAFAASAVFLS